MAARDELTASAYVDKYGIPAISIWQFSEDVIGVATDKAKNKCAICGKSRHGPNLQVEHIKVPIPTDSRYKSNMKIKTFRTKDNAILLCVQCAADYKGGKDEAVNKVKAYR